MFIQLGESLSLHNAIIIHVYTCMQSTALTMPDVIGVFKGHLTVMSHLSHIQTEVNSSIHINRALPYEYILIPLSVQSCYFSETVEMPTSLITVGSRGYRVRDHEKATMYANVHA